MATDTLTAVRNPANSGTLDELATLFQAQASRIKSLANALDEAIDFSTGGDQSVLAGLTRALDYLNLINEAAEGVRASGERLELIALEAKKGGRE